MRHPISMRVRVRNLRLPKSNALVAPWYALDGYDGILLLSQFLTDDLLYYRVPDVPIVHCIDGVQQLRHSLLKTLLTLSAFPTFKRHAGCQSLVDEGMAR